uniref:Uncharacterized protein n=1 Tax=Macrostomum lignano TaxID=282301 RepID=A0A1I8FFT8_9PLAT
MSSQVVTSINLDLFNPSPEQQSRARIAYAINVFDVLPLPALLVVVFLAYSIVLLLFRFLAYRVVSEAGEPSSESQRAGASPLLLPLLPVLRRRPATAATVGAPWPGCLNGERRLSAQAQRGVKYSMSCSATLAGSQIANSQFFLTHADDAGCSACSSSTAAATAAADDSGESPQPPPPPSLLMLLLLLFLRRSRRSLRLGCTFGYWHPRQQSGCDDTAGLHFPARFLVFEKLEM